ncbi:MAG TPA: phosphotransferase [Lachnospiraceae bacterium]|nr:phosphotransferase [Lachnospiraceae bacterium]
MILELHSHSKYSYDSLIEPIKMVKYAKKIGLDGIAITDHDTIKGGVIAQKDNRSDEFTVIVGCETKTEAGDIIGLFLNEELRSRNSLEVIDEIHDQAGIVVLPHPFRGHNLSEDLIKKVDLIEVINSRSSSEANKRAKELALSSLKNSVVGSDAHFLSEIGSSKNIFPVNFNIRKEILNGCSDIQINSSPSYLQPLSQTIKAIKQERYHDVLILLSYTFMQFIFRK